MSDARAHVEALGLPGERLGDEFARDARERDAVSGEALEKVDIRRETAEVWSAVDRQVEQSAPSVFDAGRGELWKHTQHARAVRGARGEMPVARIADCSAEQQTVIGAAVKVIESPVHVADRGVVGDQRARAVLAERLGRDEVGGNRHDPLGERRREELDYLREAAHMRLYRLMLADEKGVTVPEPIPELSTRRLLTMTWVEGRPLMEAMKLPLADRNAIARNMFRAWYIPFYYYGVIHGDPHLGNYSMRKDDGINLLDFGCIRIFAPKFVKGVIDLYHALDRNDRDLAVSA